MVRDGRSYMMLFLGLWSDACHLSSLNVTFSFFRGFIRMNSLCIGDMVDDGVFFHSRSCHYGVFLERV